jgi:hypothetical protein
MTQNNAIAAKSLSVKFLNMLKSKINSAEVPKERSV